MKKENCCSDVPLMHEKTECGEYILHSKMYDFKDEIESVKKKKFNYKVTTKSGRVLEFSMIETVEIKKGDYLEIKDGTLRITFKKTSKRDGVK